MSHLLAFSHLSQWNQSRTYRRSLADTGNVICCLWLRGGVWLYRNEELLDLCKLFSIMTTKRKGSDSHDQSILHMFFLRTEEHLMSRCIIGHLYWVEDTEKPNALKQNWIDVQSIWNAVCGLVDKTTGISVEWKTKGPQVTWTFSKTRTYYYFERLSF